VTVRSGGMMFLSGSDRITRADVERCRSDGGTRRIAFAYTHKDQLKRTDDPRFVGSFSVPFPKTIKPLFEAGTGLDLFPSRNSTGVWRSIRSEEEFDQIAGWVRDQGTRIFLRDFLDLSIALDQNFIDNHSGSYTQLGLYESVAKDKPNEAALGLLVDRYCEAIGGLPYYRDATQIAAVPARPGKLYDLPTVLADRIAKRLTLRDLTPHFCFKGTKDPIKTLELDQKWDTWERTGLAFEQELDNSQPIILIDDKYQSGITLQFVASRLCAAGAGPVFGLCAVKTLRDTDNA
jgi:hypothetical protein